MQMILMLQQATFTIGMVGRLMRIALMLQQELILTTGTMQQSMRVASMLQQQATFITRGAAYFTERAKLVRIILLLQQEAAFLMIIQQSM